MNEQELFEYYIKHRSKNKNNYSNFIYGCFLRDMLDQGRIDEKSTLYQILESKVQCHIDKERKTRTTGKIIGEFMKLSELQCYASIFIF